MEYFAGGSPNLPCVFNILHIVGGRGVPPVKWNSVVIIEVITKEALKNEHSVFPGLKPRSIYSSLDAGLKAGSTRTSTCSEFPQAQYSSKRDDSVTVLQLLAENIVGEPC